MIWLRRGRIVDPSRGLDAVGDLVISEGCIAAVGDVGDVSRYGDGEPKRVNAKGLVVAPGLIDLHAHLREPGQERKEDIRTGTRAAVAGGFTAVCCMPNTAPVIDAPEVVEDLTRRIEEKALCRVYPLGAVTRGHQNTLLSDYEALRDAGCVAVTDDAFPIQAHGLAAGVAARALRAGLPLVAHCELFEFAGDGVMNEGPVAESLGLPEHSARGELAALRLHWFVWLVDKPRAFHLHVCHVSARASADFLRQLRKTPMRVTAEVTPHHLALTDEAVRDFGANAKMNPPLRTEEDRRALVEALCDGTIDVIATDHAPHTPAEKGEGMQSAPFGVIGLETALPVALAELVTPGHLSVPEVVGKLSCAPAEVLGLPGGTLEVGAPADIVVFDPDVEYVFDEHRIYSKSKNSPFIGRKVRGKVEITIVDGEIVFRHGEAVAPTQGASG